MLKDKCLDVIDNKVYVDTEHANGSARAVSTDLNKTNTTSVTCIEGPYPDYRNVTATDNNEVKFTTCLDAHLLKRFCEIAIGLDGRKDCIPMVFEFTGQYSACFVTPVASERNSVVGQWASVIAPCKGSEPDESLKRLLR